jgi:oligoendopeptidase F
MSNVTTLPLRGEVPVEQTWDLASVYATPADWDAACVELTAQLPQLTAFRGRLAEGPATLLALLEPMQEAGILMGKIMIYAFNGASVDTGDQEAAARAGQARTLMAQLGAAVAFVDPELAAIGLEQVDAWIAETPELAFFSHYVDRLRRREAHVRSGEVEELLALTGDPFGGPMSIYGMLNNADMNFRPAVAADGTELEVGQASIGALVTDADRAVRRTAWDPATPTPTWPSRTPTHGQCASPPASSRDVFTTRACAATCLVAGSGSLDPATTSRWRCSTT